jgi:hypothetical protein
VLFCFVFSLFSVHNVANFSVLSIFDCPFGVGTEHRFHAEIVSFSICGSSPQTYVTLVDFGYPRPFGFLLPKTDLELTLSGQFLIAPSVLGNVYL